jgi:2-polyprenyl-3-methyl-5-hydroxy-6-metoxy-1,4-benzoquinol methylase
MKCYLCNNSTQIYLEKNGYSIYRCDSCGLLRTNLNQKYEEFLKIQYASGYFTGDPEKKAYEDYEKDRAYIEWNLQKFLRKIIKYKSSGRLLDVGCAMGYFVQLSQKYGFDSYGFDVSEFAITVGRKNIKNKLSIGSIDSIQYEKKSFDIITLFDVFEHLADPKKDIQKLLGFLKDDGILVLATGNTSSFFAKMNGRRWTFFNPPQHLFFYNSSNMRLFLSKMNLKVLEQFSVNKLLSLRYIFHLARSVGESKIAQLFYPVISRTFLGKMPVILPTKDNMIFIVTRT